MLRVSLRLLPVHALAVSCLLMAGLLWLVNRWPWAMWPVVVTAAGLCAAAARLFDEPSAAVVDSLPRPLWWRTLARLLPVSLLAAAWLVGLDLIDVRVAGWADLLRLEVIGIILTGAAITTALRRRGHSTPGHMVGSGMLLILIFLALKNPVPRLLPLFPYGPDGAWTGGRQLWIGIVVADVAVLVASCVERPRRGLEAH